jgi:hypothetical protein
VVEKAALGQVFSEYFGFPCQAFHRLLHTLTSSITIRGGLSNIDSVLLHPKKKKKKPIYYRKKEGRKQKRKEV